MAIGELSEARLRAIGRVYFAAVLPFFGAVVGPWLLGSFEGGEVPVFMLWSLIVLVFTAAGYFGAVAVTSANWGLVHFFVALALTSAGLLSVLFAKSPSGLFAGSASLLTLHWLNLLWMQRSYLWHQLAPDWKKQHNRFVWVVLGCHMFVLFNQLQALRGGSL